MDWSISTLPEGVRNRETFIRVTSTAFVYTYADTSFTYHYPCTVVEALINIVQHA